VKTFPAEVGNWSLNYSVLCVSSFSVTSDLAGTQRGA
jgi:hypothetical protein